MIVVWVHLTATLYLTGLIWTIQVVHYPLMNRVAVERFPEFHRQHGNRISLVVILPMAIELGTAVLLAVAVPPGVPKALVISGLVLVIAVWLSTFAIQVPCHHRLARGFDAAVHRKLVCSNWLRTAAWTARAVIAVAIAVAARS